MSNATVLQAYLNLASKILSQAMLDAESPRHAYEVVDFARSAYCESLCYVLDVDHRKYLTKIKEKVNSIGR